MKHIIAIVALSFAMLLLTRLAVAEQERIARSTFSGNWPFSVSQGILECKELKLNTGRSLRMILFHADGRTYGVNGAASSRYNSINPIWLDNPNIPGTKINIGAIIQEGLKLCN